MKMSELPKIRSGLCVGHASVKVMRSYDYCQFEVSLSFNDGDDIAVEDVDDLRKEAMRLVDRAVEQYKIAKNEREKFRPSVDLEELRRRATAVKENFPKSEWTPDHKATVKAYEDASFRASRCYDYEDDWASVEDYQ